MILSLDKIARPVVLRESCIENHNQRLCCYIPSISVVLTSFERNGSRGLNPEQLNVKLVSAAFQLNAQQFGAAWWWKCDDVDSITLPAKCSIKSSSANHLDGAGDIKTDLCEISHSHFFTVRLSRPDQGGYGRCQPIFKRSYVLRYHSGLLRQARQLYR